jgi:melanoma-associated antigen
LKTLHLTGDGEIRFSVNSTQKSLSLDDYLTNLSRQGYLDREQIGDSKKGAKKSVGTKRVRSGKDDDSGVQYQWRWGNRAFSEVSEKDMARAYGWKDK